MRRSISRLSTISVVLLLSSCDGPWNMGVDEKAPDRSLWISSVQVAQRPFDTIWIEDYVGVETRYDATNQVATSASVVEVYQDSAGVRDTVKFERAVGAIRAWIPRPDDAPKRVRWNAELSLKADVVLADGSKRFLSASSYTPAFYSIADSFAVPIEALHPRLANGSIRQAIAANPQNALRELDSTGAFFTRWKLNLQDLSAYMAGQAVMRNISVKGAHPDTVWYISDMSPVLALSIKGSKSYPIAAESRGWIFRHNIDKKRFGGAVLAQGFEPTRARILGSIFKRFGSTFGSVDSSEYFQPGGYRSWLVAPLAYDPLPGWPDSALLANTYLGYTGRNTIYSWSVDSLYYEYYRTLTGQTGDGQYSVTNIKGGKGYFTGAAKDSVSFQLEASFPDTVPVPRLNRIWCDSIKFRQSKGEATNTSKAVVQQFCGG
ncbi:MAG: hypothetical protein AAB214_07830 [Fibrobacterota bacterium]